MLGKTGLLLIKIHRDQFEVHGGTGLQVHQDVQHGVGIFATGETNHHPVTVFDHVVIGDGITGISSQALLQLVVLGFFLAGQFFHGIRPLRYEWPRILLAAPLPVQRGRGIGASTGRLITLVFYLVCHHNVRP